MRVGHRPIGDIPVRAEQPIPPAFLEDVFDVDDRRLIPPMEDAQMDDSEDSAEDVDIGPNLQIVNQQQVEQRINPEEDFEQPENRELQ